MNILLVGPLLPPVHGQSLAFTRFYESINNDSKLLINTNMENSTLLVKVFSTLKVLFLILYKLILKKIDIVYFTCSRSFLGSIKDVFLINLASFKNIKLINHLHGSDFYDFLHSSPRWYRKILFNSYNKVNTSIVLLDSMKSQFKDFQHMNLEVVSNFYDKDLDINISVKNKDDINILYLSNIIKSKGIIELIDTFNELSTKYENIYLNIAGSFMGDEYLCKNEIKKVFFKKINNNPKIKYLGKVFADEKVKLLQKSDIFVLPSYYKSEAFPISIIEAMRCGNAIITTNYKYLPEVINSKNGILVEIKSSSAIKKAIIELIKDNQKLLKMQIHNIKEVKEIYSLEQYILRLHNIINSDTK